MTIFSFAGSTSSQSINKQLVRFVLSYFQEQKTCLVDLRDYKVPLFSVDEEKIQTPEPAQEFIAAIKAADIIICSVSEHNRSFTAAFKNLIDWCSRIDRKFLQNKKVLLLSTSPGGYGGGNSMQLAKNIFPGFGAEIVASFSLPKFAENFEPEKGVTNTIFKQELETVIMEFKKQVGL